jgi:predicted Zn-dependent protease
MFVAQVLRAGAAAIRARRYHSGIPITASFSVNASIFRRITLIGLGALALTHCAQNPVTGDKNFVLMSEAQEIQMGAQAHKDVLKEYAPLDHPALQAYVNDVG